MAYSTKYQFEFNSDLEQPIVIYLKKKDTEEGEITVYAIDGCTLEYNAPTGGKRATIYGASVRLSINVGLGETSPMPDFENIEKDTWLMEVWLNEVFKIFSGYVLSDACQEPFQDPPYSIEITATDQLGLIGDTDLRKIDGSEFRGEHFIIEYIAAALQQTGQKLPIRVYDNVFHRTQLNRDTDPKWDMMGQTKLEYRTFLKDAVTFISARETLETILFPYYFLYQWNGQWVIMRKELLQYWPFAKYYTIYDADGLNAVGYEVTEDYAAVGKNAMIHPIGELHPKTLNRAIRHAKSTFLYVVWPEIPRNNKFDLGELIESGTARTEDLTIHRQSPYGAGETIGRYENYSITDWEFGTHSTGTNGKIIIEPTSQKAYRKIVKDNFLNVLEDKIVVEATPEQVYLQSEAIPLKAGDKISFSINVALYDDLAEPGGVGSDDLFNYTLAIVYLIPKNTDVPYGLDMDGKWTQGTRNIVIIQYRSGEDNREFHTGGAQSDPLPVDGDLYIALIGSNAGGEFTYFQDFNFSVTPHVAGSHRPVRGDYWLHGQSRSLSDVVDDDVKLSDSDHKIFKGTLLDAAGVPLKPDWRRHGLDERKHYRQIGNMSSYNLEYRRFAKVEGDFTGITYAPVNEQENVQPIALHKQYRMEDEPGDRRYMLSAPLRVDLYTGNIQAAFEEVYQSDPLGVQKLEPVSRLVARIRTAIEDMTAAQWGSGDFEPATGNILPGAPNKFSVSMPVGQTMNVNTTGEARVSKSEQEFLGFNVVTFVITKYAAGDTITFSAWTGEVEITVEQIISDPSDGQETGDYNDFKYIFS